MKQCAPLKNEMHRTVVLAIKLVNQQGIQKGLDNLEKALQSAKFQKAVADALKKEAKKLMKEQLKKNPKLGNGSKFAGNIFKSTGSALGKTLGNQIEKSPEYKRLKGSLNGMQCAFNKTGVGVFVDKNQTWLIIVGSVAGIAGAAGLYLARSGDLPASLVPGLLKDKLTKKIGTFEIGANITQFKPSTREVGAEIVGKLEWNKVKASFKVGATFKNDALATISSSGKVMVPISRQLRFTGQAAFLHRRPGFYPRSLGGLTGVNGINSFDLGLRLDFKANQYTKINLWYQFKDPASGRSEHVVGVGLQISL